MSRKFTPRIITVCGFSVFVGPCKSCPSAVEPWIKQFCSLPEHKWYVQIDTDWAVDWFNNYGLKEYFPNYEFALDMISDKHSHEWASMSDQNVSSIVIQAKQLYGLLHARWITQPSGLKQMKKKFESGVFGVCPRFNCKGQKLLPMGTTVKPRHHSVKLFCPRCCDIYVAPESMRIDGAHFGPAFPHLFLQEFGEFDGRREFQPTVLEAFGFPIHKSVKRFEPHAKNEYEQERPTEAK